MSTISKRKQKKLRMIQKDPDPGISDPGSGTEIPDFQLEDPDPKLFISDPR